MGLQILLVGRLRPDLGTATEHDGIPVADLRDLDALQRTVDMLGGPAGAVIVLAQREDEAEARRQLARVHVAVPHVRTTLETLPGPPLTVAVAAALAHDVSGDRDSAEQLATLQQLRRQLWSATWLPSVTRLDEPRPSLLQHARSWLPGPGFLAVAGPTGRVHRLARTTLPPLPDAPVGGALMVADQGAPEWVVPALAKTLQVDSTTPSTSWREARDSFGVDRCAELVVVPAALGGSGGLGASAPASRVECPACGIAHPRRTCPFCRMTTDPTPDQDGASS